MFKWLSCLLLASAAVVHSSALSSAVQNNASSAALQRTHAADQILVRRRRYVLFPEGSSFSCAVCMTTGVIGSPDLSFLSASVNYGVAYDLPNNITLFTGVSRDPENALLKEEPAPVASRRFRRDLYKKMESVISLLGYDGRQCVLRALCESKVLLKGRGDNMLNEILRRVFSLPATRVMSFENQGIVDYDRAHRTGRSSTGCQAMYPKCSISLIKLISGQYETLMSNYFM